MKIMIPVSTFILLKCRYGVRSVTMLIGHMKKFLEDSVNKFNNTEDKYLINNETAEMLESSGSEFNSRKSSFASDYIDRRSSMDFFLMSPIQRFKDTRSNSLSSNISL